MKPNFTIPDLKHRFKLCYNEDHRGGTFYETIFVLKEFDPEKENMVVAVLDRDVNVFKRPILVVFDGHAFPVALEEKRLEELVGKIKLEICKKRMEAIETLLRTNRINRG